MDHKEVGHYWDANASAWTRLARSGFDIYRDYLNTPAFFNKLPEVKSLQGLDIGCGEGHNTRLLAKRGARMKAVDISEIFIEQNEMQIQIMCGGQVIMIMIQTIQIIKLPVQSSYHLPIVRLTLPPLL